MSDTTNAPSAAAPKPSDIKPPEGKPQAQSETDWQARFDAQQKVNRDLEAKVKGLQSIADALGVKPEPTTGALDVAVLAATVHDLSDRFNQSEHQNRVLSVATQFGISDKDAIADLAEVKDVDAMRRLASRLGSSKAESDTSSQPGPRPDLTQGAQGTGAPADAGTAFANFLGAHLGR